MGLRRVASGSPTVQAVFPSAQDGHEQLQSLLSRTWRGPAPSAWRTCLPRGYTEFWWETRPVRGILSHLNSVYLTGAVLTAMINLS